MSEGKSTLAATLLWVRRKVLEGSALRELNYVGESQLNGAMSVIAVSGVNGTILGRWQLQVKMQ